MHNVHTVCTYAFKWTSVTKATEQVPLKKLTPLAGHSCLIVTVLTPANMLVQVCGELNLGNLLGLKLICEEGRVSVLAC